MEDRVRLVQVSVQNVKRIRAVDITPNPVGVTSIGGKNGAGKSSTLDAIWWALGGERSIQDAPLRRGAERGETRLTLSDGTVVSRVYTAKGSRLEVKGRDGLPVKGGAQTFLSGLISSGMAFDPLAFTRMNARDQVVTLLRAFGAEEDVARINSRHTEAVERRKLANAEVDRLRALARSLPAVDDAPTSEVLVSDLVAEADAARAHNQRIAEGRKWLIEAKATSDKWAQTIEDLRTKLLNAEKAKADIDDKIAAHGPSIAQAQEVNEADIRARIANADAANALYRQAQAAGKVQADLAQAVKAADKAQVAVEDVVEARRLMLRGLSTRMPRLSIADDGLRWTPASGGDPVPFGQASMSEQLRTAIEIEMATHQRLRLILVRDGALLDDDSRRLLDDMAQQYDAQVLLEVVGADGDGTIIIEDGKVRDGGES